jgi:glycosyltransferase involved in cell wall biosynthesis
MIASEPVRPAPQAPPNHAPIPAVSVILPMHNEAESACATLQALVAELESRGESFEILPVDDGSTDPTWQALAGAARDPRVRPLRHPANRGRGAALRTGFASARGTWVVTLDADLSYGVEHVGALLARLRAEPRPEMVVGSPYMPGGHVEGVPALRLCASRLGNWLLRHATGQHYHTFTGILRGYRREALRELDLVSEGKEIHLEILSQALALGWRVVEVPAVLRGRRAGASKLKWRRTTTTHLFHILSERPLALFGLAGMLLLLAGLGVLLVLLQAWRQGALNPERPLMTVLLLLVLGGFQLLAFGFLGTQIADLRRAIVRLHRSRRPAPDSPTPDQERPPLDPPPASPS